MKIVIGSDHAGVDLKKEIVDYLKEDGYEIIDCGTYTYESVDYPDIAEKVAIEVLNNKIFGVLICGTGIGISMAANKIPGIRAAVCSNIFNARLAREHNDANILAIGARVIGNGLALDILKNFLKTDFLAGRHLQRVEKIKAIEKKYLERS
jgi:RpiB/LacA/LacB family sugar-phosphate isomerase